MKRTLLILPITVLAAALALSACGGGSSSSSSSSSSGGGEGAIEETIESAATTDSPFKCTKYETVAFNEQETGASGAQATKLCEQMAEEKEEPAETVDFSNVEVEGETATADAEFHGSTLDGQTVEFELEKEGGTWKVNQFLGFAKFDPDALGKRVESGLEKTGEVSASQVKCLGEGVRGLSQDEAGEVAFENNLQPLEDLGCE